MKKTIFKGAGCALITPFKENKKVDYNALRNLIDFQINNKTDAIIVCGTTGESSTLSDYEQKRIIKTAVEHTAKRVPVIAGTGSNSTETALRRSLAAEKAGADALLLVTPYYNKCSQQGVIEHYKYISDRINTPMIIYNVPSRTGFNIKPKTYQKLSEIENVTAVKEANGDISALAQTIKLCGDNLHIYCGNDDQIAAFTALGADGVISVLSNILPKKTHELAFAGINGDTLLSSALQLQVLDLCKALFCDVNPIPIKFAMRKAGLDKGIYRLPLNETSEENKERILSELLKFS